MRGFWLGIIVVLVALPLAGLAGIYFGLMPTGADTNPSAAERWAANLGLTNAIARQSKGLENPLPETSDDVLVGMRLYARHCAVCHGTADGQPSRFAQGLYIKSPQFATAGVETDSEGAIYWIVEHGVRFTAMPGFKNTMPTQDVWKITMFLKRMDQLPPTVSAAWKHLPSAAQSPSVAQ